MGNFRLLFKAGLQCPPPDMISSHFWSLLMTSMVMGALVVFRDDADVKTTVALNLHTTTDHSHPDGVWTVVIDILSCQRKSSRNSFNGNQTGSDVILLQLNISYVLLILPSSLSSLPEKLGEWLLNQALAPRPISKVFPRAFLSVSRVLDKSINIPVSYSTGDTL